MSTPTVVIIGLAATTMAIKAFGPIVAGGRDLPRWAREIVALLAPALLAALVATQVLADGDRLGIGAETGGVAAAGLVMWRTQSVVLCVMTAATVTAVLRAAF